MRCYLKGNNKTIITGAIRALPNRTTGLTPNLMMLGREVRQPLDLVFDIKSNNSAEGVKPHKCVSKLQERLNKVHSLARKTVGGSQNYQKKFYDHSENQKRYEEGDIVYKLNLAHKTGHSSKLKPIWQGPFLITKVLSPQLYRINGKKKFTVVHHDLIKRCEDRELPFWMRRQRSKFLRSEKPQEEDKSTNLGIESLFKPDRDYQTAQTISTRSGRVTKPPSKLNEYHLY